MSFSSYCHNHTSLHLHQIVSKFVNTSDISSRIWLSDTGTNTVPWLTYWSHHVIWIVSLQGWRLAELFLELSWFYLLLFCFSSSSCLQKTLDGRNCVRVLFLVFPLGTDLFSKIIGPSLGFFENKKFFFFIVMLWLEETTYLGPSVELSHWIFLILAYRR